MPKPTEIAELWVNGQKFDDWETVQVQKAWGEAYHFFRFTAAERDTIIHTAGGKVPLWQKLQFKPPDHCTIVMAGQLAITGYIEERQVSYNATQHGVMLLGKSNTANAAKSSVDTKTGNFDDKNLKQVADEVMAPYGCSVSMLGQCDMTPFPKLQNNKGETTWDFVERLARVRGSILSADNDGNFLLIGQHQKPLVSDLIEGVNIKSCQASISHKYIFRETRVDAQHAADDDTNGTAASELTCTVGGGPTPMRSMRLTPAEQPVKTKGEVCARAGYEMIWTKGTEINVTIMIQGWLKNGAQLWEPGDEVSVYSPMAMLNMALKVRVVTMTQDSAGGTQTQLDLVAPWALLSSRNVDVSSSGGFGAPNMASVADLILTG